MMKRAIVVLILAAAVSVFAQSEGAYDAGGSASSINAGGDGEKYFGLLDPSRFDVNHSMSFMAGGTSVSDVRSQSMYSTMMRYKFNAPLVLSLNFDMPIHSTFNQYNNFTNDNLASMDYFRNMPIDASLTWVPSDRFMMRFSVIRQPESAYLYSNSGFYRPYRHYRGW
jgi:hypothetical protein